MKKRIFRETIARLLCLLAALAGLAGCAAPEKAQAQNASAVGFYFDTVVSLNAECDPPLLDAALASCARYEAILSRTREGSDVWRVNHAAGVPVTIDKETASVLRTAQQVAAASGGAFDITVAPVVELWDFSAARLPDAEALRAAVAKVGYTRLALDGDTVSLPAGMEIDLGGVAKGYIAGAVAEELRAQGVASALLSFGGSITTIGRRSDGKAWRIGVKDPTDPNGPPVASVEAVDTSVVTSGIYERGFDLNGMRYHHILDPATGMPVQNGVLSATVVCADAALADALSTACFILGPQRGIALADSFGAMVLFVDEKGAITASPGLQYELYAAE